MYKLLFLILCIFHKYSSHFILVYNKHYKAPDDVPIPHQGWISFPGDSLSWNKFSGWFPQLKQVSWVNHAAEISFPGWFLWLKQVSWVTPAVNAQSQCAVVKLNPRVLLLTDLNIWSLIDGSQLIFWNKSTWTNIVIIIIFIKRLYSSSVLCWTKLYFSQLSFSYFLRMTNQWFWSFKLELMNLSRHFSLSMKRKW